ncbi:hypothetical protein BD779DRAFT_735516 [Infundibulicybe gibba]|nr:hypothetical protein BD779DRAFT_735516 [Infundibulicybe gibba]
MSKYAPHLRSGNHPRATSSTICQKCLGTGFLSLHIPNGYYVYTPQGHFIYECKSTRPYVSRPSRTQQLENPRILAKLKAEGKPSVEVPEEFKNKTGMANKILEAKEKAREIELNPKAAGGKRKKRSSASSSSSDSTRTRTRAQIQTRTQTPILGRLLTHPQALQASRVRQRANADALPRGAALVVVAAALRRGAERPPG